MQATLIEVMNKFKCVLLAVVALLPLLSHKPLFAVTPSAGSLLKATASANYYSSSGIKALQNSSSNTLVATVSMVEAFTLSQSQSIVRSANITSQISHLLKNTGNTVSTYNFTISPNTRSCNPSFLMNSITLWEDLDANGVISPGDPQLSLNQSRSLSLLPDQSVNLIIKSTTPSNASNGASCYTFVVKADASDHLQSNVDTIQIGSNAALTLTKSVMSNNSLVIPEKSTLSYRVAASNIGNQSALGVTTSPNGANILIDGIARSLVLIRDVVPVGMQYVFGSLTASNPNAIRLFRLPGDAPMSYRSNSDDASAIEIAVALPIVAANSDLTMTFDLKILSTAKASLFNTAVVNYNDGVQVQEQNSNTVSTPYVVERIGLAMFSSTPVQGLNSLGQPDGTELTTFSFRVKNYGTAPLYNVNIIDVIEGTGTHFGTFTSSSIPAAGQYTIVSGSGSVINVIGGGTNAKLLPGFTGQLSNPTILSSDSFLDVDGEFTAQFTIRFNSTDRPNIAVLFNTAKAQAATSQNNIVSVTDQSTNGSDPDPTATNDPGNSSVPTPVDTVLPSLSIVKTADAPIATGTLGVYNVKYSFLVTNNGRVTVPNVRVSDNLDCAFQMDSSSGQIASWRIISPPVTTNGHLAASQIFTGHAPCDRNGQKVNDPVSSFPTTLALSLVDGTQSLASGQVEKITLTVQIVLKPSVVGNMILLNNKAWAVGLHANNAVISSNMIVAAVSTNAPTIIANRQGIVYDTQTFNPVPLATVTLKRLSCNDGQIRPITSSDLFGGSQFIFNSNGTVSVITGSDGSYAFFIATNNLCEYAVSVKPPRNSNLIFPSTVTPAQAGSYDQCGAIPGNSGMSQKGKVDGQYFLKYTAGSNANGTAACQVVGNNIPLDASGGSGTLVLTKHSNKSTVEFGDALDYTLTLTNSGSRPLGTVNITDSLPPGFVYQAGTSRLNNVMIADPSGGKGPSLWYVLSNVNLAPMGSVTLSYRVRVGVGAVTNGDAINSAQANTVSGITAIQSTIARSTVHVVGGVFSDEGFIFGKVYLNCSAKGQQVQGDIGIPGVRIFMEDGIGAITDSEGKWSIYGIRPITHAIKIDNSTLPKGAVLEVLDNRQSRSPDTRFVDLKSGELHKVNFAVSHCEDPDVLVEVTKRREAFKDKKIIPGAPAALEVGVTVANNVASHNVGPASGAIGGDSITLSGFALNNSLPLIDLPKATGDVLDTSTSNNAVSQAFGNTLVDNKILPLNIGQLKLDTGILKPLSVANTNDPAQLSTSSSIELETVLPSLTNALGFIELKDGDTLAGQQLNVRVKGVVGSILRLSVNGRQVELSRVGKRTTIEDKNILGWEYIGVNLLPGKNELLLEAMDDFGNHRGEEKISVIAPDQLAHIKLSVVRLAKADGKTPIKVQVSLVDANDVPVSVRTAITLENDLGRWNVTDFNSQMPGVQTFMEGGLAEFELIPPEQPGDGRIRVSSGILKNEAAISYLPDLRPLTAIGIIEGVVNLRHGAPLGSPRAGDAFEEELSNFSRGTDQHRAGRVAFYLKGAVKGEYLLTASYDSDKQVQAALFRDIRPDQFYPVYGDSSTKVYDAQSTGRLYLRIDKNRSYLLYGDFTTSSSSEVRQLSQVNRSLTGIKNEYSTSSMRVTSYLARDNSTQVILEIPANGTSGPYLLTAPGDMVLNSEQVQLIVRDKNQPSVIVSSSSMTRINDYSIDNLSKTILFNRPIASLDTNLNPQSVRISYQVSTGGPEFWVGGVDLQLKLTDSLQIGAVASYDGNPVDTRRLEAFTVLAKLGASTTVSSELVHTDTSISQNGYAGRVEVRHEDEKLQYLLQAKRTSRGFDNPGASLAQGQTLLNEHGEYKLSDNTRIRTEALYTKVEQGDSRQRSLIASVQTKLNANTTAEFGLHAGQQTNSPNGNFEYGSVSTASFNSGGVAGAPSPGTTNNTDSFVSFRSRLTTSISSVPQSQIYVEVEQAVNDRSRHIVALGGNYQFNEKIRLYGRYELIDSLYASNAALSANQIRNLGLIGVESAFMQGGKTYEELRLNDTINGRSAISATGVRNTIKISDGWNATLGAEHTNNLGNSAGLSGIRSTAVTGAFDYLGTGDLLGRIRASFALESRESDGARTFLNNAAVTYKINDDWSLLSRSILTNSISTLGGNVLQTRQQIGFAYRPVKQDMWNALGRFEHKRNRNSAGAQGIDPVSGNVTTTPEDTMTNSVSLHANIQPDLKTQMMFRFAAKQSNYTAGGIAGQYSAALFQARYLHDLNRDWDVGLQLATMRGTGGIAQNSTGAELGYQLSNNTWLSFGYNILGFRDPDLTTNSYTDKGVFLRLRMKFDEKSIGMNKLISNTNENSNYSTGTR